MQVEIEEKTKGIGYRLFPIPYSLYCLCRAGEGKFFCLETKRS